MSLISKLTTSKIRDKINFEKSYFYFTIILAFLLPITKAGISLFIILLALLWFIEGDFKRKYQEIKSSKLLIAFLIFFSFSLLSVLWSNNLETALHIARKNTYFIIIFILATSLKKEHIQPIITSFLYAMFLSELVTYGVFFELWTFWHATPTYLSPIMHHIDYSVYLAFSAILLLNRIFSNRYTLKQKIFFGIFFLTVTGNLFLSIGRTGQVSFIGAIVVMSFIHFKISFKSILLSLVLICSILTSAYSLSDSFKQRVHQGYSDIQKITHLDFDNSLGVRAAFWITTYSIVKENPLFGIGLGDYIDETAKLAKEPEYSYFGDYAFAFLTRYHPHNQYLLIALQMGLTGLVLFFYIIYTLLKQKIDDPEVKELSILFSTVFFISCLSEPLLIKQFPLSLFILFMGIFAIFSITKVENKKTGNF